MRWLSSLPSKLSSCALEPVTTLGRSYRRASQYRRCRLAGHALSHLAAPKGTVGYQGACGSIRSMLWDGNRRGGSGGNRSGGSRSGSASERTGNVPLGAPTCKVRVQFSKTERSDSRRSMYRAKDIAHLAHSAGPGVTAARLATAEISGPVRVSVQGSLLLWKNRRAISSISTAPVRESRSESC